MSTRKVIFVVLSVVTMMSLLAAAMFGDAIQKDNVYRYLSVFTEVYSLVRSNYVEEVPPEKLVEGAFSGVTQAVDEFSFYVTPAQLESFRAAIDAKPEAEAGVSLTKRFGFAYVVAVVPGSPAAQAHLGPGDFIEKIDGKPTDKLEVWQLDAALRGKSSDVRKLAVVHGGGTKREEMTVTLAALQPPAIERKDIGSVAVLRVPSFSAGTAKAFGLSLDAIRADAKRTLIIDLRGNAAQDYEEAIKCADMLLSSGTITSVAGRKVEKKIWQADRGTSFDGDVAVLTDASSAAAAEVFASAISGNRRGRVVGATTYGRAIVQKLVPLPSGGGLYLTIGHYTSPDLKPITETGVRPDVIVDRLRVDTHSGDESGSGDRQKDPVLDKALSLFEETAKKAA